jgi:hypothetical protein
MIEIEPNKITLYRPDLSLLSGRSFTYATPDGKRHEFVIESVEHYCNGRAYKQILKGYHKLPVRSG